VLTINAVFMLGKPRAYWIGKQDGDAEISRLLSVSPVGAGAGR
jgi:hypothetical protein